VTLGYSHLLPHIAPRPSENTSHLGTEALSAASNLELKPRKQPPLFMRFALMDRPLALPFMFAAQARLVLFHL